MKGKILPFKTKLSQAAEMIVDIGEHFSALCFRRINKPPSGAP
jgi:hypothetical protein